MILSIKNLESMLVKSDSFLDLLAPYKTLIEKQIQSFIETFHSHTKLSEACAYALTNGGKRFRPALVFILAKALRKGADVSMAALGVELFHTASLIADDLPCMDNDDFRRNQPAVHKLYGESTALLASYALIAAGYNCLTTNARLIEKSALPFASQSAQICMLAIENVSYNTGILGATGGQFLDLNPPDLTLKTLQEVILKKTVTLFEISFVLGWLFGGGNVDQLNLVKKASAHFGMAFQIADDLQDMAQDRANQRLVNLANVYGKEEAMKRFDQEIEQFEEMICQLHLHSEELQALVFWLKKLD
jgi:geranylgeranyl diphosphate synthase type II